MKRLTALALTLAALGTLPACSGSPSPIRVGAVYPLSGSQGPGGVDEYRGVRLAADLVNEEGGVRGHPIALEPVDVPGPDAAPGAVAWLARRGVRFVVGSYGSTISRPAEAEAARRGLLFWETGAVGSMAEPGGSGLFFRVAPSGAVLGRAAVDFVADQLAPRLHVPASSLRFAVANVDDAYGTSVALGAVDEVRSRGLRFAGRFPYDVRRLDVRALVGRIAAARPDVLFVSAYLQDGIAIRREVVRQRLPLLVNIGSSSSYCMPAFGSALGRAAVGTFASDKPDGDVVNPKALTPAAHRLLERARADYRARYHQEMSAAALAGFSAAWALFHVVMPAADRMTPQGVAAAARRVRVPTGGLPNGSGLQFAGPGAPDPGANLRAASVIWEWVGVDWREVVWPPEFATYPLRLLP